MKPRTPQSALPLVLAALAVATLTGCAMNGLPRIDPSGERFFIWPDSQPVVGPLASPGAVIAPPGGNATLPPVGSAGTTASTGPSCPLCPLCPLGCPLGGLFDDKTVIGPVAGGPPPVEPTNRVTLTPGRVLAPVGSEVVLRAGVCGKDGYLLTNRKVEWMIDQEGVGQFAEIGDAGQRDFMRYPWSTPKKINNTYAVGYTSPVHTCLRRGTADPADDLQINDGEAWVSITSPSEGTSYITAYAPNEDNWNARRAQATIYWVDAQWRLPPSAVIAAGQPHVLATTITRQTDGAPLAGWIVRYEVADGTGARLGYDAGQVSEVTSDNRGVAQVEVTPTDAQPGSSRIRITVVRPEQAGIASSPRLDVGAGEATITWSNTAAGTQPLFPPVTPQLPATPPAFPQQPTEPNPRPQLPPDNEPPIGIEPPGRPDLEVRVQKITPDPIKVGQEVTYNIVIRNIGDGVARNVRLFDVFDPGLASPQDGERVGRIDSKDNIKDIAPTGTREIPLTFDVLTAGEHWHEVTVKADGGVDAFYKADFTAIDDQPVAAAVTMQTDIAPVRPTVGDEVRFKIVLENTSNVPATNLRLEIAPDPALRVTGILPENLSNVTQALTTGGAITPLGTLAAGQKVTIRYGCNANMATQIGNPAEITAFLKGDGISLAGREQIEILPAAAAPPAAAPLGVSVQTSANPIRRNGQADVTVTLTNNTAQPLLGVNVDIRIPPQLSPRPLVADTPIGTALIAQQPFLRLSPAIASLAPGGKATIRVPYDAVNPGQGAVEARGTWQGGTAPSDGRVIVTVEP
ncbi:hypothetical protein Pla123a_39090 [Posidoniimonas polymericola]|uniref:DUF11 domain-containing protein n=1 Tax=Posidoniimonas polymericola TaxID=2528002 RepID=A0A5C5YFJ4_9BACT|nr:DUF11 domain-containing protein [Posidoniimonas polymericola]TWT73573.1 hypothetical protein Pla123a_39090 [Posidoniimonas polymericola]